MPKHAPTHMLTNMPVIIRTGILHNPALDLDAGEWLRRLLHTAVTDLTGGYARPDGRAAADRAPAGVRFVVLQESYVAHDRNWIESVLCRWCDEDELDLILTVGGTLPAPGPSARELMPKATAQVLERRLPGLSEAMRAHAGEFSELALLDGGIAGIRGRTLIINLPEGAGPACHFLEAVAHLIAPTLAHLQATGPVPRLVDELTLPASLAPFDEPDAENTEVTEHAASSPAAPLSSKLDAAEFAEFLKRRKS
ncbi:MAG: molybdopterin-binding protein [Litorilinea sp.]